jgi:hypothetical protein
MSDDAPHPSRDTDLRGLDYFTAEQAARYCGLKLTAFYEQVNLLQIPRGRAFMTRRALFRRIDLQRAIEWHGFGVRPTTAPGRGPIPGRPRRSRPICK